MVILRRAVLKSGAIRDEYVSFAVQLNGTCLLGGIGTPSQSARPLFDEGRLVPPKPDGLRLVRGGVVAEQSRKTLLAAVWFGPQANFVGVPLRSRIRQMSCDSLKHTAFCKSPMGPQIHAIPLETHGPLFLSVRRVARSLIRMWHRVKFWNPPFEMFSPPYRLLADGDEAEIKRQILMRLYNRMKRERDEI